MNRIIIIGCAGSGKSTLSLALGKSTNLPVYHLDRVFWKPNWEQISPEEWQHYVSTLVLQPSWIIDGNYSNTMEIRLKRANIVIFLDFPRYLCLWRVIKRRFQYHNKTRPDINDECKENLDLEFLRWIWKYPKRSRPRTMEFLAQYARSHTLFHIRKKKQMKHLIKNINYLVSNL